LTSKLRKMPKVSGLTSQHSHREGSLTPRLKYRVRARDPKYAAVNGRRGVDIRCFAYAMGPVMAAHEDKNKIEPKVHLVCHMAKSVPGILGV
jgi:hypothetical protein